MAPDWGKIPRQIVTFLRGLTTRQRMALGASGALAIGALYLFVWMAGRGDYKTLYSGLSPDEGQTIVRRLASESISAELSSDGTTVSVPVSELDKARLEMAAEGLPRTGRLGFEIFDKPNWSGSDFAEQVNYQRALEGELERTIESMTGVEAVRVHLALARESLFTEREREAKAAVLVKLRPHTRLADQDLGAIAYLVASAVENLKPENVRVVDADGHVPLLSHGGSTRPREAEDFENALTQKLLATLGPVVGPNQIRADVTVEYETGSNESTQETYDPNASAVLTSQTNSDRAMTQSLGGIPGSSSNVPQNPTQNVAPTVSSSAPAEGRQSENKTFAVSRTVRHTVQPAGGIKRISAAILVDDATETTVENNKKVETRRKRTPEELKEVEALAAAAIGLDPTRGDRLAVENLSFGSSSPENLTPPTLAQRIPSMVNQWAPLLRYAAPLLHYAALAVLFTFVYLLVLRPFKKQLANSFRELPQPAVPAPALVAAAATPVGGLSPVAEPANLRRLTEGSPEAKQAMLLKEALAEKATNEPVQVSRLVQDWVRQR